eukprot:5590640-Prymnesium_polylepis.4
MQSYSPRRGVRELATSVGAGCAAACSGGAVPAAKARAIRAFCQRAAAARRACLELFDSSTFPGAFGTTGSGLLAASSLYASVASPLVLPVKVSFGSPASTTTLSFALSRALRFSACRSRRGPAGAWPAGSARGLRQRAKAGESAIEAAKAEMLTTSTCELLQLWC